MNVPDVGHHHGGILCTQCSWPLTIEELKALAYLHEAVMVKPSVVRDRAPLCWACLADLFYETHGPDSDVCCGECAYFDGPGECPAIGAVVAADEYSPCWRYIPVFTH